MSVRIDGEHLLWNPRSAPTVRNGMRKPNTAMSTWMHAPVTEVYTTWLAMPAEWTAEQRAMFINIVADRLNYEAGNLATDLKDTAVRAWREQHGQHPDFTTSVQLWETSLQNAREAVVRERLYDRIPLNEDGEAIPPEPVSGVPWAKRWMDHRYRVGEPTDAIDELASEVWPDHSAMFQVLAAKLLVARLEEGRPVPRTRRDQLAHDLVPEINEMLCRMKRAPE